jgi:hypothetical protein
VAHLAEVQELEGLPLQRRELIQRLAHASFQLPGHRVSPVELKEYT